MTWQGLCNELAVVVGGLQGGVCGGWNGFRVIGMGTGVGCFVEDSGGGDASVVGTRGWGWLDCIFRLKSGFGAHM